MTNEKNQKILIEALEKSSDDKVISMLIDLKEHGKLFYLEPLLKMMISKRSDVLKKNLLEFFSDIKQQEAAPIIANFIGQHSNTPELTEVLTASWQSRLDFTEHLNIFFGILIGSSYQNAFEAFTVIENNIDWLTTNQIDEHIAMVKGALEASSHDKKLLLLEMIGVLDKTRRAAQ
ncbi:hypothetical protein [Perlabentimonas gracilis]|uniref:hypothetical protein n=1 Tax=Perlabentimonas gracilis TaxID=2715279 RepID=UPI00140C1C0E|nr:hypothetical protein [Perlabentimonas gracilis]NHB67294.1 hypothetical protein [Perlabentimonas gracilis]